jgi:hypothetical protein
MAPAGGLAGRARRPSDDVVRMQDAVHLKLLFFYGYGDLRRGAGRRSSSRRARVSVSLSLSRLLARLAYSVDFIRELLTQIAHLGA